MGEAKQKAAPPRTCQSDPVCAELLACCGAGAKATGEVLPPCMPRAEVQVPTQLLPTQQRAELRGQAGKAASPQHGQGSAFSLPRGRFSA